MNVFDLLTPFSPFYIEKSPIDYSSIPYILEKVKELKDKLNEKELFYIKETLDKIANFHANMDLALTNCIYVIKNKNKGLNDGFLIFDEQDILSNKEYLDSAAKAHLNAYYTSISQRSYFENEIMIPLKNIFFYYADFTMASLYVHLKNYGTFFKEETRSDFEQYIEDTYKLFDSWFKEFNAIVRKPLLDILEDK